MQSQTHGHWLEVETVGDVVIGRFTRCRILHEQAVQEAGEQLLGLLEHTGSPKVLLDLGGVEGMSTAFLGKLVSLARQVEAKGGRLALCHLQPFLREIIAICHFPKLVHIYSGEQEALQNF